MSEYTYVEKPFLDQLAALGWQVIDHGEGVPGDPTISYRTSFREVTLKSVFKQSVNAINRTDDGQEWLTDEQLDALHDELLNHHLDVAVFTHLQATPEFHALAYNQIKQVLIVGKSHPLSKRKSVHIKDLQGERLIIREPGSEARRATETAFEILGLSLTNVIEIGSRDGAIAAVVQGVGICMIFDEGMIPDHPAELRHFLVDRAHGEAVAVLADAHAGM